MRRLAAIAAVSVLALGAGAGTSSAASGHAKPCARKGSKTVAANSHTRVYWLRTSEGKRLYGCLRSNNHRRLLTEAFDDGYVSSAAYDHVTLVGRFVAWQQTDYDISCKADCPPGYNPTSVFLELRDLRRRSNTTVDGAIDPHGRLVLTTGGAMAWTESGFSVKALDGDGARTLASGPAIDPASLRRHGNSVSWLDGAEIRTAALAPRG